jgi:hypothetical membrane protein
MSRKILLVCGILAPLVYVGTDILACTLYPGYSFFSQAISELFAINAPTSSLMVPLFTLSSLLLIAFSAGVWVSAGSNRALRIMALMIVGNAVNGLALWNLFPMHMRGDVATFTDTMHVTLSGTGVIFILLALGFGAAAYRNWFRPYTIGTLLMLLLTGVMTFLYAPRLAANLPTPWLGLSERSSTYVYDVWQVVLAIVLLRDEKGTDSINR